MSITDVLVIVALILAIIEQFRARGQSLIVWAVILICIALLWGLLPL
jgi:hypothetical protein